MIIDRWLELLSLSSHFRKRAFVLLVCVLLDCGHSARAAIGRSNPLSLHHTRQCCSRHPTANAAPPAAHRKRGSLPRTTTTKRTASTRTITTSSNRNSSSSSSEAHHQNAPTAPRRRCCRRCRHQRPLRAPRVPCVRRCRARALPRLCWGRSPRPRGLRPPQPFAQKAGRQQMDGGGKRACARVAALCRRGDEAGWGCGGRRRGWWQHVVVLRRRWAPSDTCGYSASDRQRRAVCALESVVRPFCAAVGERSIVARPLEVGGRVVADGRRRVGEAATSGGGGWGGGAAARGAAGRSGASGGAAGARRGKGPPQEEEGQAERRWQRQS